MLRPVAPVLSLGVLYVIAVVIVAVARGLAYAIPVSIASMLTFNFLFLPPVHTFALQESANWVALAVYLVTAVVVSELATRSRRLARKAVEAETLRQSDAAKTAVSAGGQPRSSLAADGDPRGKRRPRERALTLDPRIARRLSRRSGSRCSRLERLVANLLDLSRLDAGPARRRPELWTVDTLVARALEQLGAEADGSSVSLDPDLPPIQVDAAQIERVLVNLLENALKFSSPDRSRRRSTCRRMPRSVLVASATAGPESSARRSRADLRAVRTRKRRASRQRPRSRDRARLRGGKRRRLWLEPRRAGRRDVRRWRCPAAPSTAAVAMSEARDPRRRRRAADPARSRTSLRGAGYEVEPPRRLRRRSRAAMRPPDAVILDLVLPDGSGTDVCRELRALDRRADPRPVGRRRRAGEGRGARCRRGRLRHEAVRDRRAARAPAASLRARLLRASRSSIGELVVDLEKRSVTVGGEPVSAHAHEFDLLRLFARNEGKLLTHRRSSGRLGADLRRPSRTTSTSTCRSFGGRSKPIRRGRVICSPSPAPAIASFGLLSAS